ncbi:hypothetical protein SLEP1_g53708 [Rubroshorea leprosula]|uniref:RNase H type-1 domain-containing protein n=1 Tax=Rubroshorea leprosula TaxID=152421 RepID=A0AAV5MA47_9ROSI|nr:hypothetical protein SLEP1_g53708 [Rubroshorea leprosula]
MGVPYLFEQWAIICWNIWKARNKIHFEKATFNPEHILFKANAMLQEFCSCPGRDLLMPPKQTMQRKHVTSAWLRPPPGFLKFNVDASFMPNSGLTALTMVGRDSYGKILTGRTWLCSTASSLMAEANALLRAVQSAADMGLDQVIFESDNETLISYAQHANQPLPWEIHSIIHNIRSFCSSRPNFSFSFIPRAGNRVADWIARSTLKGQCPFYWAHCPPDILLQLLLTDAVS